MASLSCSCAPGSFKYDVFLSFRGEDTRHTFTRNLREALVRMQINTYKDYEIERGEEIAPALLQAIEKSKISIVILSQDYASSTWCLDELAHILECKERYQLLVIPIFYGVDPSHVRHQKESYAAPFVRHEKHFKDKPDKVLKWRHALTKASKLAGFDSRNSPDSKLIEEVVKDIVTKLNRIAPQNVEFSSRTEDNCFKCGGIGHWPEHCPSAGDGDIFVTIAKDNCIKCGGIGHWFEHCPSAGDGDIFETIAKDNCIKCGGIGHWFDHCPSANDCDIFVAKDNCLKCGGIGHLAEHCPSADKCLKCGGIGHLAQHCPSADKCLDCGGIGHLAQHCPSRTLQHVMKICRDKSTYNLG